jgi:hypothetical protein
MSITLRRKLIVALLSSLLFAGMIISFLYVLTIDSNTSGVSILFLELSMLIFIVYFGFGIPTSYLIDFIRTKFLASFPKWLKLLFNLSAYIVFGVAVLIIALLLFTVIRDGLGNVDMKYLVALSPLGAIASLIFYILNSIVGMFRKAT